MEEFDRYFLLESNDGLKASTHLAATHLSKRFFFQIQLSRLALVRAYIKREQSTLEALLTLGGTGEGFSFPPDRSCDRPDSFLFLFSSSSSSSSFSPPPPFFLFSLSSLLPSSSAQFERIMPAKQWHKGPAGLTRRAGSLEEQLPRILLQFLQYPSSKIRWNPSGRPSCAIRANIISDAVLSLSRC